MAYKFQLGPAVMSGSLTQEGGLIIKDDDGSIRLTVDRDNGALSGSGNLQIGGTVKLDGVADAAIDVQSDSLYFLDADGLMKKEAVGDLMAAVAGNGLSESADQLQVNVDDSSIEISADTLQVKALGITDAMLAGSISDAKLAQDYVQVGEFTGSFADVLATHDTDDLAEGSSNLYYTDARARAAISEDADILSYNSSTGVLSVVGAAMSGSTLDIVGDASAAAAVRSHFSGGEMIDISSGVVSIDGAEFSGSWDAVLATKDTDDLSEGSSNLYFTDARARQAISVTDAGGDGSLAYDNSTGVITYTGPSAAEVRAHFSAGEMISIASGEIAVDAAVFSASADVRWDAKMAAADTGDLAEGSNLYFTDARARQAISVTDAGGDGSLAYDNSTGVLTYTGPSAAEVRAHFSGGEMITITDGEVAIDAALFSASADVRWDAKMAAADTGDLAEGSNLYYTDARVHNALTMEAARFITYDGSGNFAMDEALFSGSARGLLSGGEMVDYASATGEISISAVAFSGSWDDVLATKDTGDLTEGSNLYFTDARARAAISVTDSGGDGSLSYDNSTGVITYTGPSAAEVRAHFTAGDGLAVADGDFSVNVDDSSIEINADTLRIKADGVTGAMLAPAVAGVGLAQDGSGNLDVDLNELTAATVDVAADSIAIVDADDSNASRKESIADLVAAMAGSGLSATNGVLSTEAGVTQSFADANATLVEGMNFGTVTLSADRTLTLPSAPSNGDVVRVKAPASLGGNDLIVAVDGGTSHLIDGQASVVLESDGAAIAMQYVGNNVWIVF
jgi:hypothetical protein